MWPGQSAAVDQQNVLPAVAIVIKESAAGAQRLGQELAAESSAVVLKVDAGGVGHIGEAEAEIRVCRLRRERVQRDSVATRPDQPSPKERPAIHGTFTSPERMAYTTSSAVL